MTDITPILNAALKRQGALLIVSRRARDKSIDEFLKEAYRITDALTLWNSHITSLHAYLRSIRQPYLSTSLPPRRTHLSSSESSTTHLHERDRKHFTDAERDRIDAEAKQVLRELNAAIRQLAEAEQLRQNTEATLAQKKRARNGFGLLGRWAAGGVGQSKSPEEEIDAARANTIKMHRENVIWYLTRKLEECGEVQRSMMETRLYREIEKSKSVLYKTRASRRMSAVLADMDGDVPGSETAGSARSLTGSGTANKAAQMDEAERKRIEAQLSPDQLQIFAKENQDMLKHYEDTLDQVRTAERSMLEISELQTTLANNLATQSAQIDQLVEDSLHTTENVGGGNKQLKRATERKSTAKYVFYASCGLSLFLITWDLLI